MVCKALTSYCSSKTGSRETDRSQSSAKAWKASDVAKATAVAVGILAIAAGLTTHFGYQLSGNVSYSLMGAGAFLAAGGALAHVKNDCCKKKKEKPDVEVLDETQQKARTESQSATGTGTGS